MLRSPLFFQATPALRALALVLTLAATAASSARAQQPSSAALASAVAGNGQIERSRLPNPTLPLSSGGLSLGEPAAGNEAAGPAFAPSSTGDADLGVQSLLKPAAAKFQPWSVFADGGFVNTTNVALTKRGTFNDTFAIAEAGVGYEWRARENLTLSATVREQYFAYNRFNELDFGALNAGLGLAYSLPQNVLGGLLLSAQLGYTRLTRRGFDREFYRNGSLGFGAQKLVPIGRAQLLSFGGDLLLGISVPHAPEREEFGLSGGYIAQLTRHFSVQTGVRVAYFGYAASDRQDFNLSLSGGVTYAFTPWCSLGGTISGTIDRSNRPVFDYNVFNSGASVFFRLRF